MPQIDDDDDEGVETGASESEAPAPAPKAPAPANEDKRVLRQLVKANANNEAQIKHLTDFVRMLCKAEGYRTPEAFIPVTDEGKSQAADKPKAK